jgi:hypothetical protein
MSQLKISEGYVRQLFDDDGNLISQEFIACGSCEGATECYAPFTMVCDADTDVVSRKAIIELIRNLQ